MDLSPQALCSGSIEMSVCWGEGGQYPPQEVLKPQILYFENPIM